MQKLHRYLSLLDLALGLGTIGYGLYSKSYALVLLGVGGLVLASFKPAVRIQKYLENKLLAKRTAGAAATEQALSAEAFYEDATTLAVPPAPEEQQPAVFTGTVKYGPVRLGASRHNALKPEHFNLYRDETTNAVPR